MRWSGRRVLAVGAHPDDESWACGGLLRRAANEGAAVRVLTLTRGEAGFDRLARRRGEALAVVRVAELRAACALLGAEVTVAALRDGRVTLEAAFTVIRRALVEHAGSEPCVIVGLGLDGGYGHRDHIAAVLASTAVAAACPGVCVLGAVFGAGVMTPLRDRVRGFGIVDPDFVAGPLGGESWDLEVALTQGELAAKVRAIGAHASQLGVGGPEALFPSGIVQRIVPVERYRLLAGAPPW